MTENNPYYGSIISAYIAEYNSLRTEQLSRIQSQNQVFNFLMVILGVAVSATISKIGSGQDLTLVIFGILLFLPIITAPLGFIFFENEMAIHSIGSHIYWVWRPQVVHLLNKEKYLFRNALEFRHLQEQSHLIHNRLSIGRWVLFLVPTILPVAGIIIYTFLKGEWWNIYTNSQKQIESNSIIIFCYVILVIDLLLSALLIEAIFWTFPKNKISNQAKKKQKEILDNYEIDPYRPDPDFSQSDKNWGAKTGSM